MAACAVITFLPTGQSGFSASADGWGAATPRVLHYLVILAEPPQNPPDSAKIFNGVAKLIYIHTVLEIVKTVESNEQRFLNR